MEKNFESRVVENPSDFGLYVWEMPNGQIVGDDEGNFLNIPSEKGDRVKIKMLADAVRSYGVTEGRAAFMPDRRRVTNEEFEEQKMRMKFGLTPDPFDPGALMDEIRAKKEHG